MQWTILNTIPWYFKRRYTFYESSFDDPFSISLINVIVVEGGSDAIMNASLQARAGK